MELTFSQIPMSWVLVGWVRSVMQTAAARATVKRAKKQESRLRKGFAVERGTKNSKWRVGCMTDKLPPRLSASRSAWI